MIDLNEVKQLVLTENKQIFSLYLQVDASLKENQAQKPAWSIYAKNALSDINSQMKDDPTWENIHLRVQEFLQNYTPTSKGLVLFFGPDFENIYELPIRPDENTHAYGEMKAAPLLWLIDEYEHYLVVLVDQDEAHFLTTYLGYIDREEAMASDRFTFDFREKTIMPRPTSPQTDGGNVTAGSNRDSFDDKINDYINRFHNDVAQRIREILNQTNTSRVVLGGSEKAAHSVEERLHPEVKKALVGVLPIPMQDSDSEVMARVLDAALNYERSEEMVLVKEVIDLAKAAGGRGALGYEAVQEAMKMQQVEILIAQWPTDDPEMLHNLTIQAMKSGSRIELVHGAAARLLDGQVAARLYYSITNPMET